MDIALLSFADVLGGIAGIFCVRGAFPARGAAGGHI
jgi:hypothetical protein